jgi:flagellar assembly factor FliW
LEKLLNWTLLFDLDCDCVAWLQSIDCADVAFAVVSPRFFVPDYQISLPRYELEPLESEDVGSMAVLAIVGKAEGSMTLNLKAPLLINPRLRLGRQVVATGDQPIRYELAIDRSAMRKIA